MPKKKLTKEERMAEIYDENQVQSVINSRQRARSITVGTCFGGILEVGMRGDHYNMYCPLQPVEAVEVILQLAAASGIEVAMRPKKDFSSWRGWEVEGIEDNYWTGAAKFQLPRPVPVSARNLPQKEQESLPEAKEENSKEELEEKEI